MREPLIRGLARVECVALLEPGGRLPPAESESVMTDQWRDLITIEPGKRGGRPCVRGMRITVYDVLSYLAAGMSEREILDDFPYLTADDIHACLAYAAERERRMLVVPT